MLTFATEFPVGQQTRLNDLVQLAVEWIAGSPHTGFEDSLLRWSPDKDEEIFNDGDERLEIMRFNSAGTISGGVRYTRLERPKLEWITTVVGTHTRDQHWVGIRVSCDALSAGTRIPTPRKPHVVKLLLDRFGGGMDGDIEVSDGVIQLGNANIDFAASMINGTAGNQLPVVYISSGYGDDAVDAEELARWLGGMAHVVKEPNRSFSFRLMDEVQKRNAYGGAIGLYWPGGLGRKVYFPKEDVTQEELQRTITNDVRIGMAARRPLQICTWAHLSETSARLKYEALKSDKSGSVEEYITAFDGQLSALSEQLDSANREISRLQSLVQAYEARSGSREGSLLDRGNESDFYPDEANDVLLDAIAMGRQSVPQGSRRANIIDSILTANKKTGEGDKLAEQLKAILRDYKTMDAKRRSQLQDVGLVLTDEGKHIKAAFRNDPRYLFVISKTSSDHRAGLNLANEIKRSLF